MKEAKAGKALSFSPLVRACILEIFPIGNKKIGASYASLLRSRFSVVVLLPRALRDDTKRLCSRLLVLRKWPNKRPGRLFNFKGSSGGVYYVGGVYFYNCITLTSSTKLVCFRRKLQESSKIVELMRLGRLEIHTALSNSNIDFRILA